MALRQYLPFLLCAKATGGWNPWHQTILGISVLFTPAHWPGKTQTKRQWQLNMSLGFPGGMAGKNPPANAGDTGFWSGKIPHAQEQLSPCATTTEAAHSRTRNYNSRARTLQLQEPKPRACALQPEKPPQWEARAPQCRVAPARCN